MTAIGQECVLMVTAATGAAGCAQELAAQLACTVDLAAGRKEASSALKRREYSVLLLDETLAMADLESADQIVAQAGAAYPLQMNFAVSGCSRVVRETRAALMRRRAELQRSRQAGSRALEAEIGSSLTGILLELDLLLSAGQLAGDEQGRVQHIMDMTQALRQRLASEKQIARTSGEDCKQASQAVLA